MILDTEYETKVDVKLFEADKTTPHTCNTTLTENSTKVSIELKNAQYCPIITLVTQNPRSFLKFIKVSSISNNTNWDISGWNHISGTFTITEDQDSTTKIWIKVHNTKSGLVIVINNFILRKVGTKVSTKAPTEIIEDFVVDGNITYTEVNSIEPNIRSINIDFILALNRNYTLSAEGTNKTDQLTLGS